MIEVARAKEKDREILFLNTANECKMHPAIIEKDFWVCVTLDYLFNYCIWKDKFAFKGGTSLSKVYKVINRFSEDIDLILDWRVLGYATDEPWEERSNTKQQRFIEESRDRLFSYLRNEFLAEFKKGMSELLGVEIEAYIDELDSGNVNFKYPSMYSDNSILNLIRLEIGVLAAWTPAKPAKIQSYAAEKYPGAFKNKSVELRTTTAERTFWEKATILHQEALRPEGSIIPARYSRHYYDLYCMSKTNIKDAAIAQPELLEEVARFKNKFYPRGWARYDLAKVGTLHLLPAKHSLPRLRQDYADMRGIIFGEYPTFEEIMEGIAELEKEINQ